MQLADKQRKLLHIKRKLERRINTPHEKWGDRRKLRRLRRIVGNFAKPVENH